MIHILININENIQMLEDCEKKNLVAMQTPTDTL